MVLDDFFGRSDKIGEGGVHGGTGAAETDAEEEVFGSEEPSIEGGRVEAEANVGGFGDVALENWGGRIGVF